MSAGFSSKFNVPFTFEFTRTKLSALLWRANPPKQAEELGYQLTEIQQAA